MQVEFPEWMADEAAYRAATRVEARCRHDESPAWQDMAATDRVLHAGGWMAEHRLATVDGKPIGHASFRHLPTAVDRDVVIVRISVLPDCRRFGVGRSLHRLIEDAADVHGGRRLLAFVRGGEPSGVGFAHALGYREIGRSIELDVDPRRVVSSTGSNVPGIAVVSLAELRTARADWLERLYRLFIAVEADTPFPIAEVPTPRDVFRARSVDAATAMPEAFLVAIDGDEWVGFTEVRRVTGKPTRWSQELTGVLRSHRGRGIARALKEASLRNARASGIATIRTWNDSTNTAIREINNQLGFTQHQTIHQMLKTLADA